MAHIYPVPGAPRRCLEAENKTTVLLQNPLPDVVSVTSCREEREGEVRVWAHIWVSLNGAFGHYIGTGTILVDKK